MSTLTNEEIIEAIKNMSVLQLSELSKQLQEVFGVSAAAPVAVAAMPGAAPAAAAEAAPAAEEVTSFDVILTNSGEKRLNVIKTIREITGLGLKESKDLVETLPSKVKQGVNADDAKAIKAKLEAEGATVEIKPAA